MPFLFQEKNILFKSIEGKTLENPGRNKDHKINNNVQIFELIVLRDKRQIIQMDGKQHQYQKTIKFG